MSICAGCGAEDHGSNHHCTNTLVRAKGGHHDSPAVLVNQGYIMPCECHSCMAARYGNSLGILSNIPTPTYITDILEALKRIEDLLREMKNAI
jgi:hypothetical protein